MPRAQKNVAPIHPVFSKKDKFSIVIVAAKEGNRMRSYGPVSLIKLKNNLTVIEHQLNIINNNFVNKEVVLVTGFESNKVMDATPDEIIKVKNERYEETNVIKSIGIGLRAATTDKVLIIYGDLVFHPRIFDVPFQQKSSIIINEGISPSKTHIGCTFSQNNRLEQLLYELPNQWCQILYLTGKELKMFQKQAWDENKEKLYTFEIINHLISRGAGFDVLKHKGLPIVDIDASKDIELAKKIV